MIPVEEAVQQDRGAVGNRSVTRQKVLAISRSLSVAMPSANGCDSCRRQGLPAESAYNSSVFRWPE